MSWGWFVLRNIDLDNFITGDFVLDYFDLDSIQWYCVQYFCLYSQVYIIKIEKKISRFYIFFNTLTIFWFHYNSRFTVLVFYYSKRLNWFIMLLISQWKMLILLYIYALHTKCWFPCKNSNSFCFLSNIYNN